MATSVHNFFLLALILCLRETRGRSNETHAPAGATKDTHYPTAVNVGVLGRAAWHVPASVVFHIFCRLFRSFRFLIQVCVGFVFSFLLLFAMVHSELMESNRRGLASLYRTSELSYPRSFQMGAR